MGWKTNISQAYNKSKLKKIATLLRIAIFKISKMIHQSHRIANTNQENRKQHDNYANYKRSECFY